MLQNADIATSKGGPVSQTSTHEIVHEDTDDCTTMTNLTAPSESENMTYPYPYTSDITILTYSDYPDISVVFDEDTTYYNYAFNANEQYIIGKIEEVTAQVLSYVVLQLYIDRDGSIADYNDIIIDREYLGREAYGALIQDTLDALLVDDDDGKITFAEFEARVIEFILGGGSHDFFETLTEEAKTVFIETALQSYTEPSVSEHFQDQEKLNQSIDLITE